MSFHSVYSVCSLEQLLYVTSNEKKGVGAMKRLVIGIALLVLLSSPASSQQSKDASYSCITELAGSGWYNPSTNRWEGGSVNPNSVGIPRFVLKITFIGERAYETVTGQREIEYYNVVIMPSRAAFKVACYVISGVDRLNQVSLVSDTLKCNGYLNFYAYL
jgi:hypothetical protein